MRWGRAVVSAPPGQLIGRAAWAAEAGPTLERAAWDLNLAIEELNLSPQNQQVLGSVPPPVDDILA